MKTCIILTSHRRQAGVSTLAACLAIEFAAQRLNTLVLDCTTGAVLRNLIGETKPPDTDGGTTRAPVRSVQHHRLRYQAVQHPDLLGQACASADESVILVDVGPMSPTLAAWLAPLETPLLFYILPMEAHAVRTLPTAASCLSDLYRRHPGLRFLGFGFQRYRGEASASQELKQELERLADGFIVGRAVDELAVGEHPTLQQLRHLRPAFRSVAFDLMDRLALVAPEGPAHEPNDAPPQAYERRHRPKTTGVLSWLRSLVGEPSSPDESAECVQMPVQHVPGCLVP